MARSDRNRRYYEKNAARILAAKAERDAARRAEISAYNAAYYSLHKGLLTRRFREALERLLEEIAASSSALDQRPSSLRAKLETLRDHPSTSEIERTAAVAALKRIAASRA